MGNPFRAAAKRLITAPAPQRRAWDGAAFTRLTADWVMASSRSANGELRWELRTLRNRTRELVRNSPFGRRFHQLMAEKVVGASGFQLCAKNLLKDGTDLFTAANSSIEDAWADWCRPVNSDVQRRLTFTEQLCLAASAWGTDGEIFARHLRGPQFGPYGYKVQLIDPDYLCDQLSTPDVVPGAEFPIEQGIELDDWGGPVAYHFWTRHPYDQQGRFMGPNAVPRIRIAAADLVHAFIPLRVGQSRGVPFAAAVMAMISQLDGYLEAEVVASRIASCAMFAVEDLPNGDGPAPNPNAAIGDGQVPPDGSATPSASGSEIPAIAEPGLGLDLRGKGKLSMFDPQHPTTAFPSATRMFCYLIGMGIGVSYGTLTGDLSQANYGSLRVGLLDEETHWERLQKFDIDHVVDPIYREWMKMALLNGAIPGITDRNPDRWNRHEWQPRGFDWIDPLKDIQGDLLGVAAGVNSLARVAAKRGLDLEKIVEERAAEIKLFKEAGVPSDLATTITDRPADESDPGGADEGDQKPATDAAGGNSTTGAAAKGAAAKSFARRLLRRVS